MNDELYLNNVKLGNPTVEINIIFIVHNRMLSCQQTQFTLLKCYSKQVASNNNCQNEFSIFI